MGTLGRGSARASIGPAIFLLMACAFPVLSMGQATSSPTPAQVEAFRNLPPGQQQAVLEAVSGQASGTTRRDPQLTKPVVPTTATKDQPAAGSAAVDMGPPVITSRATLLLDVSVRPEILKVEGPLKDLIVSRRDRIAAGNPYTVDDEGRLTLPLLSPIALGGLTDVQAAQRLNADPRLQGMQFLVALLPIEPTGTEALKPFGYDLFTEAPATFAPVDDVPVPADYRLGPGDNITIELFGKKSARYLLVVDRNGALMIPEFGPVQVNGMSFDQVRGGIDQRVSTQMIGVRASVTMGQLRSIKVFVVGDATRPGAYTVSGLSTITNALFTSGGVSKIGSLRNIELKRGGATVARLDLYDLLLRGDTSKDLPLRQGDAILVPAIGSTAGIAGEIRRPAIYEFRAGDSVGDLIELSGGLSPQADPRQARLERIGANRERAVLNIDVSGESGRDVRLLSGDVLTIPQVFADTRGVMLDGHVLRPGAYAWREGMRLSDLLGSLQVFRVNADQRYVLIRREHLPERRIEAISADAARAIAERGGAADPLLQSGDRVMVFSRQADRGAPLGDLVEEMRLQARDNQAQPVVSINGRVRAPGDYPLEANMTIDALLRAGGGFDEAASPTSAELTRYEVINGESRKTEVLQLNLASATGTATQLRPYDVLVVKETPDWRARESITLTGEVRFPGTYPIRKGERLSSVIERAGGLTDIAFAKGSVFTREELKEQERKQIQTLVDRLQGDLALVALQNTQSTNGQNVTETLAAGQSLLTQLREATPTGRLVINLEQALRNEQSDDDIELRGGDTLVVPRFKHYVSVIGEVQNATTHVYKNDLDRDDYVQLSGGTTERADEKRTYVVRANGSVIAQPGAYWFRRGSSNRMEPGDTVVVPIDADRVRALPLWTAITSVVANLAISAAALASL